VSDDLVDFTDVYPTLVEMAGANVPEGTMLDGRSIVGLLDGSAGPSRKRTWIYAQLGGGRMVRDQRYLLNNRGGFYDLKADPLQQNNLAQSADPTAAAARKRLGAVLNKMPADAAAPFEGFRGASATKSQRLRDKRK
jgi:arylsulfatase A-like enzyme